MTAREEHIYQLLRENIVLICALAKLDQDETFVIGNDEIIDGNKNVVFHKENTPYMGVLIS